MDSRLGIYDWPPLTFLGTIKGRTSGQTLTCNLLLVSLETGRLQVWHLQAGSCLLSEMEVTIETGFVSCGHFKIAVLARTKRD